MKTLSLLDRNQRRFRLLPAEAQRAALHRLALRGCDPTSISAQTGLPENEVRRHLSGAALVPFPGALTRHGARSNSALA